MLSSAQHHHRFPEMHAKAVSGEFYDMLVDFVVEEQWLVGCSFQSDDGKEEDMGMGIMSGHAYALLDCKTVTTDAGKQVRLLKIRNPWGMKGVFCFPLLVVSSIIYLFFVHRVDGNGCMLRLRVFVLVFSDSYIFFRVHGLMTLLSGLRA